MTPTKRVRQAIDGGGYTPLAQGEAAVTWFEFRPDARQGAYRNVVLLAGHRHVQLSISPTGRRVRVFVDGQEVGGNTPTRPVPPTRRRRKEPTR